jgi:ribosomal protein S18 acetylase RimI-like enzyme
VTGTFSIEPLSASHDRPAFNSGNEALDRYLHAQAGQDIRRRIANCFIATPDSIVVAGYYTLAAASIPLLELPEAEKKQLPRYSVLPAALIGRLAVDRRFQGRGLGGVLLFDALKRATLAEPAIFAMIVDAKDDDAAAFYNRYGFRSFASRPMSLFLPLATAAKRSL